MDGRHRRRTASVRKLERQDRISFCKFGADPFQRNLSYRKRDVELGPHPGQSELENHRPRLAARPQLPILNLYSLRRRLHDERIAAAGAVVDPDALRLQIAVDRFDTALAAKPGGLVAAERHREADRAIG